MLDPKFIQENPEYVIEKVGTRGLKIDLNEFLRLSQDRKTILQTVESLRSDLNTTSKLIGQMKKNGEDASSLIADMKKVSDEIKNQDEKLKEFDLDLKKLILNIPNIPHKSVPVGTSSRGQSGNPQLWGKTRVRFHSRSPTGT